MLLSGRTEVSTAGGQPELGGGREPAGRTARTATGAAVHRSPL